MTRGLNNDVYQRLRRLLVLSQLATGQRLTESEWAERLNANRSAVREAMMALASDGLLRRGEAGGYFVPTYDQEELDLIVEARLVLESGAIRLLANRDVPAEAWDRLDEVCRQTRLMVDNWYEFGFVESDRRFHLVLVELPGNPRLLQMYRNAPLPLMPDPQVDPELRRSNAEGTLAEHVQLAHHLRRGEYEQAVKLLQRHLHVRHRVLVPFA